MTHAATGADRCWATLERPAMGSVATIHVHAVEPDRLADWAAGELERLERCWTRFDPASELCRLNRAAGRPVVVSETLLAPLLRARWLHARTAGRFDPTVLGSLERLGYDRTFDEVAAHAPADVSGVDACPGFGAVRIDARSRLVVAPAGRRIDLGGIGKGLAADLVATGLVRRGASAALVSVGGDMRAAGDPGDPWPVPIDPHATGTPIDVHLLRTGGLAASTTALRRWATRDGHVHHHVIDPRTGRSAIGPLSAVAVAAGAAWIAEGLAKAALVAGPVEGRRLLTLDASASWLVVGPPAPPVRAPSAMATS